MTGDPAPLVLAAGSVLDADPTQVVRAAAGAGFDGVGLRLSGAHALDASEAVALAAEAAANGVSVHDVEVHRIGEPRADPGPLIDAAVAVGAAHLLVVSDLTDVAETRRRLRRVAARSEAAGLVVGLEYMAWTTPADPATAVDLADDTGSVVVVDLLHHVRLGAGVAELAAVVDSGRLGWVQLCDADAEPPPPGDLVGEARHRRRPPGDGDLPLDELLAVVPTGVTLSVEVQSDILSAALPPPARAAVLHRSARAVVARCDRARAIRS